jgi:hypothetical protein
MVLSIGIFFTLMILGLAGSLPTALTHGLVAQGVPRADAARVAALPPVSIMFAALLGYNPIQTLLGNVIHKLPPSHAAYLTGHSFFPSLIAGPFSRGLAVAFDFAIAACVVAAVASLLRGRKYVHGVDPEPEARAPRTRTVVGAAVNGTVSASPASNGMSIRNAALTDPGAPRGALARADERSSGERL